KKLGAVRAKHRVMTQLELLARLSALVPPPRYPLVRFHGVLAPRSAWRREIVPRPPIDSSWKAGTIGKIGPAAASPPGQRTRSGCPKAPTAACEPNSGAARFRNGMRSGAAPRARVPSSAATIVGNVTNGARRVDAIGDRDRRLDAEQVTANVLSVRHW